MTSFEHQFFDAPLRESQPLRNDRCPTVLYKAVFEHFKEIKNIAALLLASKSFQNSSFGANFILKWAVDCHSIGLLKSVLFPASCFSLQFVPSLDVVQSWDDSDKIHRGIPNFVGEMVKTKYLHLSLQSLSLSYATNAVFSFFFGSFSKEWPKLQELTLEECAVNDSVLALIVKKAAQLRTLNLPNNSVITDFGLERIAKLVNITSLNLSGCDKITDAGLEHISKLSSVSCLKLAFCNKITDTGIEHIAKLSSITSLGLAFCNTITDAGLEVISKLVNITSLNLFGCYGITDVGLEHITKLSNVTTLDLRNCVTITDAGLEHLAKLSSITSLNLTYCHKITDEALLNLQTALPNCQILGKHV